MNRILTLSVAAATVASKRRGRPTRALTIDPANPNTDNARRFLAELDEASREPQ